jgi:fructose-1,6-bisphosphatase
MIKSSHSLLSLFIVAILSCSSCEKNIDQAKDSLIGSWQVTEIYSYYGTRVNLGTSVTQDFTEKGSLGTFEFTNGKANFSYKRRDTIYNGSEPYTLSVEQKKNGFINSPFYTVALTSISYECTFGDQTSDAQKKATKIVLLYESPVGQPYFGYNLHLMK